MLKAGKPLDDVWNIPILNSSAKERIGYPTQKPLALLERIIQASSNEGDLVMDAFCGCGTAVDAAAKLGRKYLGIDVSAIAVRLMEQRLASRGDAVKPVIYGLDRFRPVWVVWRRDCRFRMNLSVKVLDFVQLGGPTWTVGRTIFEMRIGLRG